MADGLPRQPRDELEQRRYVFRKRQKDELSEWMPDQVDNTCDIVARTW